MEPQPANGGIATCPRNRRDIFNRLLGRKLQTKEALARPNDLAAALQLRAIRERLGR